MSRHRISRGVVVEARVSAFFEKVGEEAEEEEEGEARTGAGTGAAGSPSEEWWGVGAGHREMIPSQGAGPLACLCPNCSAFGDGDGDGIARTLGLLTRHGLS